MAEGLVLHELTKRFGGITAVDNLTAAVPPGSIFAMIGPNGAGKSTVINLITGLYKPTAGQILFDGKPIGGLNPVHIARMGISRTFQNIRLFKSLSVLDNVLVSQHRATPGRFAAAVLGLPAYRREEAQMRERAREVLQFLGLWAHQDRAAGELPYGDQRMVEIARALVRQPKLLMLDEPAAGLIPPEVERLMALIRGIRDRGVTVVLIEHNMDLIMRISEQILVLDFGRKVAEGPPGEIRENPKVIEAYLGRRKRHAAGS